eukprot:GEMP01009969.1.p1 GENE.GEMP01009969.1~~GEMP01009969.1.p1  ORF type:complete len:992 (+),score=217.76 GEMP01009969.1:61-2976(+)
MGETEKIEDGRYRLKLDELQERYSHEVMELNMELDSVVEKAHFGLQEAQYQISQLKARLKRYDERSANGELASTKSPRTEQPCKRSSSTQWDDGDALRCEKRPDFYHVSAPTTRMYTTTGVTSGNKRLERPQRGATGFGERRKSQRGTPPRSPRQNTAAGMHTIEDILRPLKDGRATSPHKHGGNSKTNVLGDGGPEVDGQINKNTCRDDVGQKHGDAENQVPIDNATDRRNESARSAGQIARDGDDDAGNLDPDSWDLCVNPALSGWGIEEVVQEVMHYLGQHEVPISDGSDRFRHLRSTVASSQRRPNLSMSPMHQHFVTNPRAASSPLPARGTATAPTLSASSTAPPPMTDPRNLPSLITYNAGSPALPADNEVSTSTHPRHPAVVAYYDSLGNTTQPTITWSTRNAPPPTTSRQPLGARATVSTVITHAHPDDGAADKGPSASLRTASLRTPTTISGGNQRNSRSRERSSRSVSPTHASPHGTGLIDGQKDYRTVRSWSGGGGNIQPAFHASTRVMDDADGRPSAQDTAAATWRNAESGRAWTDRCRLRKAPPQDGLPNTGWDPSILAFDDRVDQWSPNTRLNTRVAPDDCSPNTGLTRSAQAADNSRDVFLASQQVGNARRNSSMLAFDNVVDDAPQEWVEFIAQRAPAQNSLTQPLSGPRSTSPIPPSFDPHFGGIQPPRDPRSSLKQVFRAPVAAALRNMETRHAAAALDDPIATVMQATALERMQRASLSDPVAPNVVSSEYNTDVTTRKAIVTGENSGVAIEEGASERAIRQLGIHNHWATSSLSQPTTVPLSAYLDADWFPVGDDDEDEDPVVALLRYSCGEGVVDGWLSRGSETRGKPNISPQEHVSSARQIRANSAGSSPVHVRQASVEAGSTYSSPVRLQQETMLTISPRKDGGVDEGLMASSHKGTLFVSCASSRGRNPSPLSVLQEGAVVGLGWGKTPYVRQPLDSSRAGVKIIDR